jgi:hypothetical protein
MVRVCDSAIVLETPQWMDDVWNLSHIDLIEKHVRKVDHGLHVRQRAQVQTVLPLLRVLVNNLGRHRGPFRRYTIDKEVDPTKHKLLPKQFKLVVGIGVRKAQQRAVVRFLDHVLDVAQGQEVDGTARTKEVRRIDCASSLTSPLPIDHVYFGIGFFSKNLRPHNNNPNNNNNNVIGQR